jgi:hypothetical protein
MKIKDIVLKYWKPFKWVLFFATLLALCLSISKCSSYKRQYENSYREYRDTLSVYLNKYNEAYAMNNAYITDLNTLKRENKELYDEIKSLRDNPIIVTKVKTEYVIDTITVTQELTTDTTTGDFFTNIAYADEWNSFNGRFSGNIYTGSSVFSLDQLQFNCSLTTDLIERDGKLYFITKSDNPYMRITDMDGFLVSPEKSKVLKKTFNRPWGVMIGAGCTATVYDGKILLLPGINLTLGYKILSF